MRGAATLLMLALALAACSQDDATPASTTAAATASPSSSTTTTTQQRTTESAISAASTTTTTVDPQNDCRLVADLEQPEELVRWQLVNDGVMGGRSIAQTDVADSVLTVTGEIVTDGGGFSSVRLA
ncbi:MAG: CIA30 family protein, partial [Acidimicrobiales bacterium]